MAQSLHNLSCFFVSETSLALHAAGLPAAGYTLSNDSDHTLADLHTARAEVYYALARLFSARPEEIRELLCATTTLCHLCHSIAEVRRRMAGRGGAARPPGGDLHHHLEAICEASQASHDPMTSNLTEQSSRFQHLWNGANHSRGPKPPPPEWIDGLSDQKIRALYESTGIPIDPQSDDTRNPFPILFASLGLLACQRVIALESDRPKNRDAAARAERLMLGGSPALWLGQVARWMACRRDFPFHTQLSRLAVGFIRLDARRALRETSCPVSH